MSTTDEFGWVIERAETAPSTPWYWTGWPREAAWTRLHNEAVRFARKVDAENIAQRIMPSVSVRVCEHGWMPARSTRRTAMKLADLAEKAAALPPRSDFQWPGAEHFSDYNFNLATTTLPKAVEYIDALRKRMGEYSMALNDLCNAYEKMRDLLLTFNVDSNV